MNSSKANQSSAVALLVFSVSLATGQQQGAHGTLNLVVPNSRGRIIIPASNADVQWQNFTLYDQGNRPVFQTKNKSTDVVASYTLFPNQTGSSTPKICRDDVVSAASRSLSSAPGLVDIKQET